MNGTKTLLQSRTVIGALLVIVAPVIERVFGVEINAVMQADMAASLTDLMQVVGALLAIYGRVKATKKVRVGSGLPMLILIAGTAAMLSACVTVDVNDCRKGVLSTQEAVSSAYGNAATLLEGDIIDAGTAETALKVIDSANALTDRAAPLCQADPVTAGAYLAQAGAALLDLSVIYGGNHE